MRNQGQGHIRQRGKGSWELKFDLDPDPVTGKRRSRTVTVHGTKREAQAELTRLLSRRNEGTHVDPAKVTLGDFLDRWERDWAALNVSPKTLERYGELLRNHVRQHIGRVSLQKLRPVQLAELYAKLARETGLSPRTILHVHRVLHRALGHATQWGLVRQNVATLVDPPRVSATEIAILRADEINAVLDELHGRALYPVAIAALGTGMRRGELVALRWQDVDLDRGVIRVEQSLEATKGRLRFKPPKTKYGRRSITLPASLVAELHAHRTAQLKQRLALGLGKAPPDGLVFAAWDGKVRHPDGLTKEWSDAMKAIGRSKITLHSLRHTHASQLIAAGLDVLTISRRLGHGSPAITLGVYGHLFANTDARAAEVIEAALAPRAPR